MSEPAVAYCVAVRRVATVEQVSEIYVLAPQSADEHEVGQLARRTAEEVAKDLNWSTWSDPDEADFEYFSDEVYMDHVLRANPATGVLEKEG